MELKNRVKTLIEKGLEQNLSLFLVDWSIGTNNAIKVIIDGDNGVSVEDCVTISRAIEHNLNREEEDFSLEVTSCGIFSPLKLKRQYIKNIGRTLEVKTQNETLEGELKSVDDENIIIETQTREPKPIGKGKVNVVKQHAITLSNIKEAKIVVKF